MTSFLQQANALDQRGRTDEALDVIYQATDAMLRAGRFDAINDLFRTEDLSIDLVLALLVTTLAAADRLPGRAAYLDRAQEEHGAELFAGLDCPGTAC